MKVGPSLSRCGLESLYMDNLMAITKTKAYSNLVLQIRVAPISDLVLQIRVAPISKFVWHLFRHLFRNSCGTYFGTDFRSTYFGSSNSCGTYFGHHQEHEGLLKPRSSNSCGTYFGTYFGLRYQRTGLRFSKF